MSIFKKLFGDNKTNTPIVSTSIDFDLLVEKARNSGQSVDLNNLYSAFFDLKEWVYIVSKNCSIENAKPFIGVIDENPWLFVFTDQKKADQYAKTYGNFHENNGNTLVIKMNSSNSLNMVQQLNQRGVIGVRINEGENGWFTDIPGLFNIKNYLKK